MAKRGPVGLSISQLREILAARQGDLKKLMRQRKALEKQLSAIDARIARIDGATLGRGGGRGAGNGAAGNGGGGKRARNAVSLVEALEKVLGDKGKPMGVGEIVDGVLASGYRSTSPAFRAIVNQTLIKEKKKFGSTGRGIYQLKK